MHLIRKKGEINVTFLKSKFSTQNNTFTIYTKKCKISQNPSVIY